MPVRKLVVMGQGYVGLPLAMRAVEVGYSVIGFDVDPGRIAHLASGKSYVEDIAPRQIQDALQRSRYMPTTDVNQLAGFDVAVITVPTPLRDGNPDLSYIEAAGKTLAPHVSKGATVSLESTTYPGTTEELLAPILESGSGLRAGGDFHLGYSPERIDPGNREWGLANTPKVVSGIDADSLAHVSAFYQDIVETVVPVSSPKEAELAKLLENTYRHVNIAMVNEFAIFAHDLGIDIWESIDAASSKPFGFMRFTPGPGVGGHCLPVDPSFLSWRVKRQLGHPFRFIDLADDINNHMPDYVVQRIGTALNQRSMAVKGARILVLGLAYKRNTSDVRESPAIDVVELLCELGADVRVADPHVSDLKLHGGRSLPCTMTTLTADEVNAADLIVLLVDHDAFDLSLLGGKQVIDTRHVLPASSAVEYL